MKNLILIAFMACVAFASCKKETINPNKKIDVPLEYVLKFDNVAPVTLPQYRYPIDPTVTNVRTIYLVRTKAMADSSMAEVVADLDARGYKPAVINYSIKVMDTCRAQVVKITTQASNINPESFFEFSNGQNMTVQYFYWDSTGATLDDRFISTKQIAATASYVFVEKK